MVEPKKKYDNKAIAGTVIFHIALLLLAIFFGLSTPLPLPEEEGVLVNLGYMDEGTGIRQPLTASPPPPQPQPTQAAPEAEDIVTQDTEESIAIPDSPRPQPERPRPEEPVREPTQPQPETTQQQPQPEPEPQVDPRAIFPGRDRRTTETQTQGETGQAGNQGRPDGSTDGTAFQGGGQGVGVEFSLEGRGRRNIPDPVYTSNSIGRVVVSITVNRNGDVIRAVAGARGTTTTDRELFQAAEKAARQATFDASNNAPIEQTGTITFFFLRQN